MSTVEQQHNNSPNLGSQAPPRESLPSPFFWAYPKEHQPEIVPKPEPAPHDDTTFCFPHCAPCKLTQFYTENSEYGCLGCLTEAHNNSRLPLFHKETREIIIADISRYGKLLRRFKKIAWSFTVTAMRWGLQIYFLSLTLSNEQIGYLKRDLDRFLQWLKKKLERKLGKGNFLVLWVPEIQKKRYERDGVMALHWHLAIAAPAGTMPDYYKDKTVPIGTNQLKCRTEGSIITEEAIWKEWKRGMVLCSAAKEDVTTYLGKYMTKDMEDQPQFKNLRRFGTSREVVKNAIAAWAAERLIEMDDLGLLQGRTWKFQRNRILVYEQDKKVMEIRTPWKVYPGARDQELRDRYLTGAFGNEIPEVVVSPEKAPQQVETLPFWPPGFGRIDPPPHGLTFSRENPIISHEENPVFRLKRLSDLLPLEVKEGNQGDGERPKNQAGRLCQLPWPPLAIPDPQPFAPLTILPADTYDPQAWFTSPERAWLIEQHLLPKSGEETDHSAEIDPAGGSPPAFGFGGEHSAGGQRTKRDRTKRRTRE